MKNFILFLMLLKGCTALSQKISDLYGSWKFESIAEGTQVKDINQANALMQSLSYRFYPDGSYIAGVMGVNESGTFTFDGTTIELKNQKGAVSNLPLLATTPERLTVTLKKYPVHLKRVPMDNIGLQLTKKWKLAAIRVPDEEEEDNPYPVPENSSVYFNPDRTYRLSLAGTNETGFWDYRENDGKYSFVLASGGKSKYWPIVRYSDNELIIKFNASNQEFVFVPL